MKVGRHMFGASVPRLESNQGVILRVMTIKNISSETLISSVRL